jgi:glycosyltransferase involved in cell wall biosynthesis
MKQVIYLWNYTEWGGAQIYFLSIIKNAPPDWHFTVILPRDSKPEIIEFFEKHGVAFDFLETHISMSAPDIFNRVLRQWRRMISEISIYLALLKYSLNSSVIHIEAAPWQSWILLFLLSLRTNVFVTMHNGLPEDISAWRKYLWSARLNFLFRRARFHLFAANQNAIDSLQKFLSPDFHHKPVLTRASINIEEIQKISEEKADRAKIFEKLGLPKDKFVVLCVGQFIDRKGRWTFLESAKEIAATHPDVFFVWLTQQPPNEADCEKIAGYEVGNSFRLILSKDVGANHRDVLSFFRLCDVFVLPSFWEGLPIAILEAMALGVATISTRINAIPEAVVDGETGLLIEPGNARQLTEAILKLYADASLRSLLACRGREFVLQKFDERVAGRTALEEYEKCLNGQTA